MPTPPDGIDEDMFSGCPFVCLSVHADKSYYRDIW